MFGISKGEPQTYARPIYDKFLKTGDSGFLPPAILPTLNGKKLNSEQYERLQQYVGQARKWRIEPYINDAATVEGSEYVGEAGGKKFSQLDDKQQKFMLQYIYDKGREEGVEKFYTDYPNLRPEEKKKDYSNDAYEKIFKIYQKNKKPN
jgi:hypothetical protein